MPEKINPDSGPSENILNLFCLLLFSGREYSLSNLAGHMGCSRQSVMRMMDKIDACGKGVVISEKRSGRRWYRLDLPRGSRPRAILETGELERLAMCRDLLEHMLPCAMSREVASAAHKAATLLREYELRSSALSRKGHSVAKGKINYDGHGRIIEMLYDAIDDGRVCEVNYRSPTSGKERAHEFVPSRVVAYRNALYVRGWKVTEKGTPEVISPTMLAVHRILSMQPTRRKLPEETRLALPPLEETGFFGVSAQNPFKARARFVPPAADYVRERIWGTEQSLKDLENGGVELSFTAQSEMEVIKWILSFGNEAELIEPETLRAKLIAELDQARAMYGCKSG